MRRLKALGYYAYSVFEMVFHFKNWLTMVPLFLHRTPSGMRKLKLSNPQIEIMVRSAMDVWSVKETFLDQFYTRYGVAVQDGWTVVDVGAGIGDYCLYAAHSNPKVKLYAFEPYPGSFSLLKKNLALNEIENVHTFQKAVWSRTGELGLDLASGEPLQISSQEKLNELQGAESISVEAVSLESLITAEKIKKIDLLKMDCEGAEYEILFNTPEKTLQRVDRIIMEYHNLDQDHTHPALAAFLEVRGFRVKCHSNFVHDHIGYLYAVQKKLSPEESVNDRA